LYRTTRDGRLRTRAHSILLAGEQRLTAPALAASVGEDDQRVRNWLNRSLAEGIEGHKDRPMPGAPAKITPASEEQLLAAVRRRPHSLGHPSSFWTLQRVADYMAEQTGMQVADETVRKLLKKGERVLSRPHHKIPSPDPRVPGKKRRLKRRVMGCRQGMSSITRMPLP
jgi:transposase